MAGGRLVGVPACTGRLGPHDIHFAGDKYLRAVAEWAGAVPVILPAFGELIDSEAVLDRLDGLLITGSPSNVEPWRYGGPPSAPGTLHDPARDATTLPLIAAAIARDLPVLAICRGLQELNVVRGGSLHQAIQDQPGLADHRADPAQPVDDQYGPAHPVSLTPDGWLRGLYGRDTLTVNSLHAQGIDRLGAGLVVEATAPDGLVEAVRLPGARFVVATQWHPEWRPDQYPDNARLLHAFGAALG